MPVRNNLPTPACPSLHDCGEDVSNTDWNNAMNSLKALMDGGRIVFEARYHRVNNAIFLPVSGYTPLSTSTISIDHYVEILPGFDKFVLVMDMQLIQSTQGGNPFYQNVSVILSDGNINQQLASYTSNPATPGNIGTVFTTKINSGGINGNIMPQQGLSKQCKVSLVLNTVNAGATVGGLGIRGLFGVQLKQVKHC